MSNHHDLAAGGDTVNLAGGRAYTQSPELELISLLLTSFAEDTYYAPAFDIFGRLKQLTADCDKKYVAQAAVYARTRFGMRSITHVVASELAKHIGGEAWARDFYAAIVHRPDDMMKILAYHTARNGKVPNSMKKGFAKAFDKFDRYSLAKYQKRTDGFSLADVASLVHPKPTDHNAEALHDLMEGELRSFDTWESELSLAGQMATNQEEKAKLKEAVWKRLISEKKLGYFALLRNLRNIIFQAPDMLDETLRQLTDRERIKKSLVLPFRYLTANLEIEKLANAKGKNFSRNAQQTETEQTLSQDLLKEVLIAIDQAVEIALDNVTVFSGKTLVALDTSGSMGAWWYEHTKSPRMIGSLFAAILAKTNDCDLMTFDWHATYREINRAAPVISIAKSIPGGGWATNFHSIFEAADKPYDRIIILTDMQGWVGLSTPEFALEEYKTRTGADPMIYSFDLQNYGTSQFHQEKVLSLAGYSEKVFDIMALVEQNPDAMVQEVKKVEF